MRYWLAKSEPEEYGWEDMIQVEQALWDGVRNYTARNNMRQMSDGDPVLIYHSGKLPEIVGIAKVTGTAFDDPKDSTGRWSAIYLKAESRFFRPVSLATIKSIPLFESSSLLRISRLSIHELSEEAYEMILALSKG